MSPKSYHDYARITGSADEPTIIEDFEDGDLSRYSTTLETGNRQPNFTTQQTTVYNGTSALKADPDGNNAGGHILDTTVNEDYPVAGDTWHWFIQVTGESDLAGMDYAVQDKDNFYYALFHENQDRIDILKYKNGSIVEQITSNSFSYTLGSWLSGEISWGSDGKQEFKIYDPTDNSQLEKVSLNDTEWVDGGIGWSYGNGSGDIGVAYYDYAKSNQF